MPSNVRNFCILFDKLLSIREDELSSRKTLIRENIMAFNHSAAKNKMKTLSNDELFFMAKDCTDAVRANPENPKNDEYADTALYAWSELSSRRED